MPSDKCLQFFVFWLGNYSYKASKLTFIMGFRTISWNECHGSHIDTVIISWGFECRSIKWGGISCSWTIFNVFTPCSFIITRSVTTTRYCLNHNYIHIQHMYHTPCTHQRHPIPHSHEWENNVLLIGDSYENIDRVIKRLDITIRFASFSVMNVLLLNGSGVG